MAYQHGKKFAHFILASFLPILCLAGELRFCYNGPQRIQYKDCPGGFISKKILNTTCLYYYKAEGVPNMVSIFSDDICEAGNHRELDREFQDFDENEFQFIKFTDIDEENGETVGSDSAPDKCNHTCLADWKEIKHWDPVSIFVDKHELNETEVDENAKEYVELTKIIMIRIINEDEDDDEDNYDNSDGKKNSSYSPKVDILHSPVAVSANFPLPGIQKLLAKSMRIVFYKCEPFIESSFYTLVFRTMQEFRRMNNNFPSMNVVPFKRILNYLDKCEKKTNELFFLNGTTCDEKHIVRTITNLQKPTQVKYKVQPRSFRWGRYDPIVEAAWSAVDFVHAFCFDIFSQDLLHYSLYTKAMVEVFTQPLIQKHWMNPAPVGKGMTLWEMAYDTPDIKNQLSNLDACVIGAYQDSIFDDRLERPFATEEALKNPEFLDDPTIPAPGWTKSIEEYWKYYEKRGFKDITEELGYCLQTPEDFNSTQEHVIAETCQSQKN